MPPRGVEELAAAEWEAEHAEARIIALADLWLDRPDTLDALARVLAGASPSAWAALPARSLRTWCSVAEGCCGLECSAGEVS